jgi:hypothetical protein
MNLDDAYTEFLTNQVAPPPAPPVPEPVAAPEPPLQLNEDQPDDFGLPGIITGGGGLDERLDTRPSARAVDPTMRDDLRVGTMEFLQNQFGMDKFKARRFSEQLIGTAGELSSTALGIGVADLLPFTAAPLTMQEGAQQFSEGMETGSGTDMAIGGVVTALGALEALPVVAGGYKMLNKAAQTEVAQEFINAAADAFTRTGQVTQDTLIKAGQAAQTRLDSMMSGTTLSANPVGAAGDAMIAGAGKVAKAMQPQEPVVQPNDLTASLYVEQPIPGFADSIEQTRRLPSEDLTAQRQNGLLPFLHVKTTVADPIGGFVKTIKPGNAQRAFSALDTAAQRHPDPAASPETWVAYQADLMGKKPNTETAVSLPPYQLIRYKNDPQTLTNVMRNLTDEQAGMAKQGLDAAEEIGGAYASGAMTPQDTAELLLWGMLSRQKSAYPHEAAFIDLVSHTDANGMTLRSFVDKVADGSFSKADTESYLKWAKEVMPVGTPGRAAVDNMNAYGKNMLPTLTKEVDGKTVLNHIHEMISDPNKSGREIRREFFRLAEGSGIDNKVLSFVLLLTGRKDVMVLDRIQFNHMWNDGRFGDYNLYTPVSQMNPDGSPVLTPKGKPAMMTGSTISDIGKNAYGLMIYEAMERELETILPQVYNSLGRDFRGLGQFHWESWVLTSQQEAAHPSVASFVNRAQEGTNLPPSSMEAGVFSREGRFDAVAYGAEYGQKADGSRVIRYPNSEGKPFEFTPDQFQKFTKDIVKPSKGVVYKGFKPTDFSEGTIPWVNDERINRQALDELIRQSGAVAN